MLLAFPGVNLIELPCLCCLQPCKQLYLYHFSQPDVQVGCQGTSCGICHRPKAETGGQRPDEVR